MPQPVAVDLSGAVAVGFHQEPVVDFGVAVGKAEPAAWQVAMRAGGRCRGFRRTGPERMVRGFGCDGEADGAGSGAAVGAGGAIRQDIKVGVVVGAFDAPDGLLAPPADAGRPASFGLPNRLTQHFPVLA